MTNAQVPPRRMTSRERLLAAMRGEPVDRVPVSPHGFGRLDPAGDVARELVARTDPFISCWHGADVFGGALVEQEWTTEGNLTRCVTHTPGGDLTRTIKATDVARHTIEYPCKGPADLEAFLSAPWEPQPPDPSRYEELCERWGDDALITVGVPDGICLPAEWLSPEAFCLLRADAPDLLAHATAEGARRVEALVEAACAAGVGAFRIVGGEYASTQLGPDAFEELVVEHDRRLVDLMHRHGAVAYFHNHGPIMRYLEPIARIGVDFLDPLEMPPFADTDLERAREIIDGRYCIVGTFDDMEMLGKWPLDRVKAGVAERLDAYGTRGICLGGSASGTYGERAATAFMAMADAVEEFCA